ncbi:MAG TPA: hypothetical protein VN923_01440, partial [Thermoanaerobaculia bacterium]|nr:hypothetical protein [Thermoanaerobaculia bacterium]
VGYAPMDDPRLVGVVALDEPWPAYYGGLTAAPTFAAIARQVLLYWGVPPQPGTVPAPGFEAPPAPLPPLGMPTVQLASAPPLTAGAPSAAPAIVPSALGEIDAGEGDALDGAATPSWTEALRESAARATARIPAAAIAASDGLDGLIVDDVLEAVPAVDAVAVAPRALAPGAPPAALARPPHASGAGNGAGAATTTAGAASGGTH